MNMAQSYAEFDAMYLSCGESASNDGWLKLAVDYPTIRNQFRGLPRKTGLRVVVHIEDEIEANAQYQTLKPTEAKGSFGTFAKMLKISGFFRAPEVHALAGSDEAYQAWCRLQSDAIDGGCGDYVANMGEYRCEYAHINFADNSGIGMKAQYSGLPMRHEHHMLIQHRAGNQPLKAIYLEAHPNKQQDYLSLSADDLMRRLVVAHLERWAFDALKAQFAQDSWTWVGPDVFLRFCEQHNIMHLVPREYIQAMQLMENTGRQHDG